MRRFLLIVLSAVFLGGVGFWILTSPALFHAVRGRAVTLPDAFQADAGRGERLFWAGGCASCHKSEPSDNKVLLGGGHELKTPFGIFVVPNISPHPRDGIGGWRFEDFALAMREGLLPDGSHAFPAFPYTAYQRMSVTDLADLFAFLQTVPAVEGRQAPHALAFPFNIRRGLGLWKWLYLDGAEFSADSSQSALWNQGAYLVNGAGHCAECHSPRTVLGGLSPYKRFAGGRMPDGGAGRVPNLTPHQDGLGSWSLEDIEEFLKTGFTPSFDSAGGSMAEVIKNMGHLNGEDRKAIALYLKSLKPLPKAP